MSANKDIDIDIQTLTTYLESEVEGFKGPLIADKFSGGQSNPTYLIKAESGDYVLRRQPFGKLLPSAHAVDREYRVLKALANSPVPVAKAYHLCTDSTVIGSMFYLMSYEQGRILWDPALIELDKVDRKPMYEELIRVLAALHDVDPEAVDLSDYGSASGYYPRQLARWSKQYRAAQTEEMPEMEHLIVWLNDNMPTEHGRASLVHGDFRFDNLIYDQNSPKALALLDWELSTLGHPLSDLAYFCMALRLPSGGQVSGLADINRETAGIPSEQEIIEMYCHHRKIERIEHWDFYLVMSFFRLASICQGVYKRALDGNASNKAALETGKMTQMLASMALNIINKES